MACRSNKEFLVTNQDFVQNCIASGIIDIHEQNDSLYIQLRTPSKNTIWKNDKKADRIKIMTLLEKLHFPTQKYGTIDVYKKASSEPFNTFFDSEFVLQKQEAYCSRCIQRTIVDDEEYILDQIERDVICLTFKSHNVSEFLRSVCFYNRRPREQRARHFLLYVMQNDPVLQTFYKICKERDLLRKALVKCEYCRSEGAALLKRTNVPNKQHDRFKIKKGHSTVEEHFVIGKERDEYLPSDYTSEKDYRFDSRPTFTLEHVKGFNEQLPKDWQSSIDITADDEDAVSRIIDKPYEVNASTRIDKTLGEKGNWSN